MANFWYGTIVNTSSPTNPVPCTVVIDTSEWLTVINTLLTQTNVSLIGSLDDQNPIPGIFTVLSQIQNTHAEINSNLIETAKCLRIISQGLSNLATQYTSQASIVTVKTALNASIASNQIKSNTFYKVSSPEKPVVPDLKTQLSDAMQGGTKMMFVGGFSGAVKNGTNYIVSGMTTFVTGTAIYKTLTSWFPSAIETVLTPLPDSPQDIASKVAAKAGVAR